MHINTTSTSPLAFSMHQVEHQRLLVIDDAHEASFDDLVRQVEQGRDDLQACLFQSGFLPQQFEKLGWALSANLQAGLYRLYAHPYEELKTQLLEYGNIVLTDHC